MSLSGPRSSFRRLLLVLSLAAPWLPNSSAAAEPGVPVLVADLDAGSRERSPDFHRIAAFGQLIALAGSDEDHGVEPWLSDGTPAGSRRIADLAPGLADSRPRLFLALPGRLLFVASDGFRERLYSSSGGLEGGELARLADDVATGAVAGSRAFLVTSGGAVYESDGTPAGTRLLGSACPAVGCAGAPSFALFPFGDALYFSYGGQFLRVAPGQAPVVVHPALGVVSELAALDGSRFVVRAGSPHSSLWVSDGTAAGTLPLEPAGSSLDLHDLVSFGGRVYALRGLNGEGPVYSTDGSPGLRTETGFPAGVRQLLGATASGLFYQRPSPASGQQVRLLLPSGAHRDTAVVSSDFQDLRWLGETAGRVLLADRYQVWRTDGTASGTVLAGDLSSEGAAEVGGDFYLVGDPQGPSARPLGLYRVGATGPLEAAVATLEAPVGTAPQTYPLGDLLAVAAHTLETIHPGQAAHLWRLDPDSLAASIADSLAFLPLRSNGQLLFAQADTYDFISNLVAMGPDSFTHLLAVGLVADSVVGPGGALLFGDRDGGELLWRSDGTPAGTGVLADLLNGAGMPVYCGSPDYCFESAMPARLTASGGNVFFIAASPPPALHGIQLYVQRGTAAPQVVRQLPGTFIPEYLPTLVPLPGERVAVIVADDYLGSHYTPSTAYVSDGTPQGTYPFLTFERDSASERPAAALGGRLVVADFDRLLIADPAGGAAEVLLEGPRVFALAAEGSQVFIGAYEPATGAELWVSDGTAAGTRRLEIRPGDAPALAPGVEIHPLGDGRVAFAADDGVAGNELYLSDGSAAGTVRVADLSPGLAASTPRHFHRRGDRLFFAASDGVRGAELWALDLPAPLPACPPDKLCLLGGRFEAEVTATVSGAAFAGQRALAGSESGIFTFFGEGNWEMMVKLLDGCGLNQRFWVFASAATDVAYELRIRDRATGETRTYRHEAGSPATPIIDQGSFAGCAAPAPAPAYSATLPEPAPARYCPGDATALCLGAGGRFRVQASWQTADGSGEARPVPYGSLASGLFTFFSPGNWEMLVKVLDGCALNGRHWIYAAGTTDVGWRLEVEDLLTHETKVYQSPLGQPALTITDSDALGGCR